MLAGLYFGVIRKICVCLFFQYMDLSCLMPENQYLFLGYPDEFIFKLSHRNNQESKPDYQVSRKCVNPKLVIKSCRDKSNTENNNNNSS